MPRNVTKRGINIFIVYPLKFPGHFWDVYVEIEIIIPLTKMMVEDG